LARVRFGVEVIDQDVLLPGEALRADLSAQSGGVRWPSMPSPTRAVALGAQAIAHGDVAPIRCDVHPITVPMVTPRKRTGEPISRPVTGLIEERLVDHRIATERLWRQVRERTEASRNVTTTKSPSFQWLVVASWAAYGGGMLIDGRSLSGWRSVIELRLKNERTRISVLWSRSCRGRLRDDALRGLVEHDATLADVEDAVEVVVTNDQRQAKARAEREQQVVDLGCGHRVEAGPKARRKRLAAARAHRPRDRAASSCRPRARRASCPRALQATSAAGLHDREDRVLR